jgi:hypothetical protein
VIVIPKQQDIYIYIIKDIVLYKYSMGIDLIKESVIKSVNRILIALEDLS